MRLILLLLFFLSGAAGLSYEVAWTRSMIFVLGNTNLAMGLVLAVFLLGFFLGGLGGSRWDRDRPGLLRRYALVEAGIGVMGLVFPLLTGVAKNLYPAAAGWLSPDAVRVLFCVILLLAPTYLMGATFPLMNGIFITRRDRAAQGAGLIYAVQTLGAAAGAAASGFFLIRLFGLAQTSWITAGVNGAVALAALLLSFRLEGFSDRVAVPAGGPAPAEGLEIDVIAEDRGVGSALHVMLFCTGFASLALEILWTRILVFFVDGLTYSFTAMLVVYLAALAAGSGVLALWSRFRQPGYAAGGMILAAGGIATVASLLWIPHLYDITQAVKGDLSQYGFLNFLLSALAGSGLIIFIPSLLIGMATPLAIGILVRERGSACRESGVAYAASCLGCCAGALAASLLAVPWLGLKTAVVMSGILVLTAGVLLFNVSRAWWFFKVFMCLAPLAAAFMLALQVLLAPPGVSYSSQRYIPAPLVYDSHVFKRPSRRGAVYLEGYAEGNVLTASVVIDVRSGERRLYTDGFNAASTGPAYRYMRMMAHLPVMACPDPRRALVIGYGTGTTAGSLSLHRGIREMEIVEISQAVMDLAGHFRHFNRGVGLSAPFAMNPDGEEGEESSVRVHTGMDGRDFLNLSRRGFDIITLEPLMPYTPAAVHFYTAEFYELCLEKLNPGGVVCQWVPLNAVPVEDLKLLLGTFAATMPSSGFFSFENSLLLLGFGGPSWTLQASRVTGLFSQDGVLQDLNVAGCPDAASVLGAYVCDGESMRKLVSRGGLLRDNRTTVEYVRIAPGVESYRRMAQGFGLLSAMLEPIGDHVAWDDLEHDERERLSGEVETHGLSFRYFLRGLQAEADRTFEMYFPGSGLVKDDPDLLFQKAFNLNPRDRRAARKHALSLISRASGLMLQGRFGEARRLVDGASLYGSDLFELITAEALLCLSSHDLTGLRRSLDRMTMERPHTNMERALKARLARLEGRDEEADRNERSLEDRGGLSPQESRLVERAFEEARRRNAAESVDLEHLLDLLTAGPLGVTASGGRAWSEAAAAEEDLLAQARVLLLEELARGGESVRAAASGLAFFKDEEVVNALRDAYIGASPDVRTVVLDALFRTGDRATYLQVLRSSSATAELLLKATEIAAAVGSWDAVTSLIDLLEHRSEKVRVGALVALIEMTRMRFDFDPYGTEEARAEAVARWRDWDQRRKGQGEEE